MKTSLNLVLLSMLLGVCSAFSQEEETYEPPATYLETVLETRELGFTPTWNWTPVPGRSSSFEIEITSPSTWVSAHLCVDGHSLKTIKSGDSRFKWSFANLEPGTHTVTLLVIDPEGNAGITSRELN